MAVLQAEVDIWYHIGVTFDGETMAVYVDGEAALIQTVPASDFPTPPVIDYLKVSLAAAV